MPYLRQTNFSGGELDPKLWGRTDLPKFAVGLRRMRNFFPSKHGAAVSRPGTTFIGLAKASAAHRFIGFVYSDSQSYALEFGEHYIRFHSDGGTVEVAGIPYEVVTTYAAADLARLQWAQTGDILTITHPSYPPMELRRLAHDSWTLTEVVFSAIAPYFASVDNPADVTNGPKIVAPLPVADVSHPAREWIWKVTVVAQDSSTGNIFETLPFTVNRSYDGGADDSPSFPLVDNNIAVYPDRAVTLRRSEPAGLVSQSPGWDTYKTLAFNYYRGRGDVFGFVGQTKTREFIDVGQEPDYAIQPPTGSNPFLIYDNHGTLIRTERPTTVAFFQERRVFGGTAERPATVLTSSTGNYVDFDEHTIHTAGEALVYELAARKREDIRSLLVASRLLIFTNASVWSMAGVQGSPLDFDSVDARVEEEIGISFLPPLLVDGAVLFSRAKGAGVRGLVFDEGRDGVTGVDLSTVSQHLFVGVEKKVVDWTYAEDPWGLVWVVREDGVLLSFTYSQTEQIWGWARHDTDGLVRSICAVSEGEEDAVYLMVERTLYGETQTSIERMTSRVQRGTVEDDICLDCSLKYQGSRVLTLTGLDHLEGETVYVVGKDNPVYGPFTVVGGSITLPELPALNSFGTGGEGGDQVVLYVGLLYTPELESLDVASSEARMKEKIVTRAGFEVAESKGGLHVGQDFEHLTPWRQRKVADSYAPPGAATQLVDVMIRGTWNQSARVVLRQTLPLPVTVVGLTREVQSGD